MGRWPRWEGDPDGKVTLAMKAYLNAQLVDKVWKHTAAITCWVTQKIKHIMSLCWGTYLFYHVGSSVALYERVQWGDKEVVILHLGYELRHDMRGKCGIIALSSLRTAVRAEDVSIFLLTFRAHFVHFDASRFIEGWSMQFRFLRWNHSKLLISKVDWNLKAVLGT